MKHLQMESTGSASLDTRHFPSNLVLCNSLRCVTHTWCHVGVGAMTDHCECPVSVSERPNSFLPSHTIKPHALRQPGTTEKPQRPQALTLWAMFKTMATFETMGHIGSFPTLFLPSAFGLSWLFSVTYRSPGCMAVTPGPRGRLRSGEALWGSPR